MDAREALIVIGVLERCGRVQVVKGQADAWALAMSHIRLDDAQAAVTLMIRDPAPASRWVIPNDVIAAVEVIRRERIRAVLDGSLPCPPPEIDPDDVPAYQAWRRSFMRALGDGRTLHAAETVACEAAGIPPVHRPVEVHRAPEFRQIGGT